MLCTILQVFYFFKCFFDLFPLRLIHTAYVLWPDAFLGYNWLW